MSFSLGGVSYFIVCLLCVAFVGLLLGRITIKGVNLGSAGVFLVAILFGIFFYPNLAEQLGTDTKNALGIVENLGLTLFITSVGFIAGPTFFTNLRKNFKSFVLLGFSIILIGGITAALCILYDVHVCGGDPAETGAITVGLFSGALTSTPAFSAAKSTVETIDPALVDNVTVGNGIAYLFGVVGVVLFVQLMPILLKANVEKEREAILKSAKKEKEAKKNAPSFSLDSFGFAVFFLAALLGNLLGKVSIGKFSLTATGGCLLLALVFGHLGKAGKLSLLPPTSTLKVFREFGLVLFLMGAGIPGGAKFLEYFKPNYFVYGALMTLIPMVIGFLLAKYVLKLPLFHNLGSITGGMTSTPALGTLIHVSKTEEVAAAYAATYPVALICVVITAQIIVLLFC